MTTLSILLLAVVVTGCAQVGTQSNMRHHSVIGQPAKLKNSLVLMPLDVEVIELGVTSVEEVPEWTERARQSLGSALTTLDSERADLRLRPMPKLSRKQQAVVDEHVGLFNVTAGAALWATQFGGQPWNHKTERFDYTIGPGLKFFSKKARSRLAMFVMAEDQISSGGRVAAGVATAILFGAAPAAGISTTIVGVVDLHTGDILWIDYLANAGGRDLRDPDDAYKMMRDLLEGYPNDVAQAD